MNSVLLGKNLYKNGEVKILSISTDKIYFKIRNKYDITYTVTEFKFSDCTCPYGSFWGINKREHSPCKHQHACQEMIRDKGLKELYEKYHE